MIRNTVLVSLAALLLLSCATLSSPAANPESASLNAAFSTAGRVFVVEPVDGLGLYQDEARESLEAVAVWARRHGYRTVDPARTWQMLTRARAGLSATTSAACGLPLDTSTAVGRWGHGLGANGVVTSGVSCDRKSCTLDVRLYDRVDFLAGKELAVFDAPYDRSLPEPAALARALAHLGPPKYSGLGGLGLGGTGEPARAPLPERFTWDVSLSGIASSLVAAGSEAPGSGVHLTDVLAGGTARLRACFGADDATEYLRFSGDGHGRVIRCEPAYEREPEALCACKVLAASASVPASMRGHRFDATLSLQAAEHVGPDGYIVVGSIRQAIDPYRGRDGKQYWRARVTDRSIADWSPPPGSAAARCLADAPGHTKRLLSATVAFDATGHPTGVAIAATRGPPPTQAEARCLGRAFRVAEAPCPAVPESTAVATVEIYYQATPEVAHAH